MSNARQITSAAGRGRQAIQCIGVSNEVVCASGAWSVMTAIEQSSVRNHLLKLLSPEDFAALHLERVSLPVTLVLVEPNVPIRHLYFMKQGVVSITTDTLAGHIQVGMIGQEGLVAASPVILGSDRSLHRHCVQMPGEGLRIATEDLLGAIEQSSSLRLHLMRGIHVLMNQMAQTAYANAVCTIEIRPSTLVAHVPRSGGS